MASIDFRRSHALGIEQARQAVEAIAAEIAKDLKITSAWEGNTLRFHRPGAEGAIEVSESDARFHVDLSLLLRPLKPTIERQVQQYFDRYFHQA